MAEPVPNRMNDAGSPSTSPVSESPTPPALPGTPPPDDHLLPEGDPGNARLNAAAETIGSAVGSAVGSVRRAGSHLRVVGGRGRSDASDTMSETAARARERVSDLAGQAGETVSELKNRASDLTERASERVSDYSSVARDRMNYARRRARFLVNEYPVQAIAGFAALSFVIGIALRVWRSNGH